MKDQLHKRKIQKLEERLVNAEAANSSLQRKCDAHVNVKSNLENEVNIQAFEIASLSYNNGTFSLITILITARSEGIVAEQTEKRTEAYRQKISNTNFTREKCQ